MAEKLQQLFEDLLGPANVRINGDKPWDLRVLHDGFYERVLRDGSLGLGESYMDGWWDCDRIDECFARVLKAGVQDRILGKRQLLFQALKTRLTNPQSVRRAFVVGERHYDLGNDLYEQMLDKRLTYTCGYWKDAATLDEAQKAKLDLTCRKLNLKPGERVLDIGCGWGSFLKYAAENYGVEAVGITVSKEQLALGRERCRGLPIEIRLQDYRELNEPFDAIVSLGMFEHVGGKNYRTYMKVVHRCLKEHGLFLLHTIGSNTLTPMDPWLEKYIFPGSALPSAEQITQAASGLLMLEDWHNFGMDYDTTLLAWHKNFEEQWPKLSEKYDERFRRMWRYYLLACAATFRTRLNQLWQIVFSKGGYPGGYASIR